MSTVSSFLEDTLNCLVSLNFSAAMFRLRALLVAIAFFFPPTMNCSNSMNLHHRIYYSKPRAWDFIAGLASQFCVCQNICAK